MTLDDFYAPTIIAMIIAVVAWLSRTWITARLTQSIKAEYDAKLVAVQQETAHKFNEKERLAQNIWRQREQAGASGLQALSASNLALVERTFDAAELLLSAQRTLSKAIMHVHAVSMLNWEEIEKDLDNHGLSDFMSAIKTSGIQMDDLVTKDIEKCQLYLSKNSWAYYKAYEAIVIFSVTRVEVVSRGLSLKTLKPDINEVIITALPQFEELLNKFGVGAYSQMLQPLADAFVESLRNDVLGTSVSDKAVKKAQDILDAVHKVEKNSLEGL
ncbi:MAG: hypothetical protein AAFP97_03930 [Pseudomonadota bacterium]